jgi:enamine deaminase RidA (YjgF/YER057c/UK114 family)
MRQNISGSSNWEPIVGYSRAVRVGNIVEVSGTTAAQGDVVIGEGDAYLQTRAAIETIAKALSTAGATLSDVVRTRMFVTDISLWEEYGRAHGEFFRDIRPVATMVEVKALIDPRLMVEVEATAILPD